MSRVRLKSPLPSPAANDAAILIETTAWELPADGLTPLWKALPSEPDPSPSDGAVLPFATTLRRVG